MENDLHDVYSLVQFYQKTHLFGALTHLFKIERAHCTCSNPYIII